MAKFGKREFRLGAFWLSQRGLGWYRTWYDADGRQTRRASLDTSDFEQAKERLTDWYMANARGREKAATATLGDIFRVYQLEHANGLRSAKTVAILLRYWTDHWGAETDVSEVRDVHKQEDFQRVLFEAGLAHNSVNRVLEIGRAAIRRAWKRGMIENAPFIHTLEPELEKPKGRPLTPDEIGKLYAASSDHIRLFIVLMLGTAARNEAITTLTWSQVDFDNGLVHLNPEGRKQTSKRRPTVRLIPAVKERLQTLDNTSPNVLMFRGEKVGKVQTAWRKSVTRAKLEGEVTPYSLRHTAARWMRKEGVPPWETAMQLGHKLPGYSMSERYAAWDPSYLSHASVALDKLIRLSVPSDAPPIPSGR